MGLAVGPDGSLYFAAENIGRIRRVGPDGIITTVAGGGANYESNNQAGPATSFALGEPDDVAVGRDGSLYITEGSTGRVLLVAPDGTMTVVAFGSGNSDYTGDGGPAIAAGGNTAAVAVDPNGYLDLGDIDRVLLVAPSLPGFSTTDLFLPSEDGSQLYQFNSVGKQLRTLDALTGATLYQFGYDSAGRLTSVTDGDGNVTTIERDASGNPTAIVAPGGQRTTLAVNANGYISSISDPAGDTTALTYGNGGLMSTFTDPKGNAHQFTYDSTGRLIKDADPAGGSTTLSRTDTANGYIVTETYALGQTETHEMEFLPTGEIQHIDTGADGGITEDDTFPNGSETLTDPEGTKVTIQKGPDPRWGMLAPVITSETETTPAGLTQTITDAQTATLTDPTNPLSLKTLTDTLRVNGQTYTSVFDATARTITSTSSANRQSVTTLDSQDRIVEEQTPGIDPLFLTYDTQGRLTSIAQGSGIGAQTFSLSYNSDNTLNTLTDAMGNTVLLGYDAAGDITQETLPDGQVISATYDANGNTTSITPPRRSATTFTSTPINLTASTTAPDAGSGPSQTLYDYNKARQLSQITLPTGQTISLGYDSEGRLSTMTLPTGQIGTTYDSTTGNLASISAPGGVNLAYTYDGSLLTGSTWSGPVAGSVTRTYNNNFLTASLSVDGGTPIAFQYDADNLLTNAGNLTLTYDPKNGSLTSTTLGNVSDAITYDAFGNPASYTASVSGTAVYSVQ